MGRRFEKNIARYVRLGSTGTFVWNRISGATSVSCAARVTPISYTTGTAFANCICSFTVGDSANANSGFRMGIGDTAAGTGNNFPYVGARSTTTDTFQAVKYLVTPALVTPIVISVTIDFANDLVRLYTNGVLRTSTSVTFNASSVTPGTGTTNFDGIGGFMNGAAPSSTTFQFDGGISEFSFWQGDIGDDGHAAYADGVCSTQLLSDKLVLYFPLYSYERARNYVLPDVDIRDTLLGTKATHHYVAGGV